MRCKNCAVAQKLASQIQSSRARITFMQKVIVTVVGWSGLRASELQHNSYIPLQIDIYGFSMVVCTLYSVQSSGPNWDLWLNLLSAEVKSEVERRCNLLCSLFSHHWISSADWRPTRPLTPTHCTVLVWFPDCACNRVQSGNETTHLVHVFSGSLAASFLQASLPFLPSCVPPRDRGRWVVS